MRCIQEEGVQDKASGGHHDCFWLDSLIRHQFPPMGHVILLCLYFRLLQFFALSKRHTVAEWRQNVLQAVVLDAPLMLQFLLFASQRERVQKRVAVA